LPQVTQCSEMQYTLTHGGLPVRW